MEFKDLSTLEIKISFATGEEEKLGLMAYHGKNKLNSKHLIIKIGMLMEKQPGNTNKLEILHF